MVGSSLVSSCFHTDFWFIPVNSKAALEAERLLSEDEALFGNLSVEELRSELKYQKATLA